MKISFPGLIFAQYKSIKLLKLLINKWSLRFSIDGFVLFADLGAEGAAAASPGGEEVRLSLWICRPRASYR